jgi:peptidoglycan/LPS O-acetylase OafA/YrhL
VETSSGRPNPPALPGKLDGLTGLRIGAALWVAAFHFREVTPTRVWAYPGIDPFVQRGYYGVELFFVLSGFILSYVYFEVFREGVTRTAFWTFITFRFARLYPVHLVTFVMMVALFVASLLLTGSGGTPSRYSWESVVTTLTLTHAWFPGIESPNLPAWSISAEWFAYLFFPFLCIALARIPGGRYLFIVVGLGFAVVEIFAPNDLLRIAACFPIGMAAFQFWRLGLTRLARVPYLGFISLAALVIWACSPLSSEAVLGIPLFALLIVALANGSDWLSTGLAVRPLVYLGEISYAVYMLHWVARVVVRTGLARAGLLDSLPAPVIVAAYFALTMVAAVLLYHFVERPGRRTLRRLADRVPRARARVKDVAPTVS